MNSVAYFAAGCFWGVENNFIDLPGIVNTEVGYMGGTKENPTYEDVLTRTTGHTETVKVEYDPEKISYEKLLEKFWEIHDPTQINRQGADVGSNYRSAIFHTNSEQQKIAHKSKERLEKSGKFSKSIVSEIAPAGIFWKAEEYHQHYLEKAKNPPCQI